MFSFVSGLMCREFSLRALSVVDLRRGRRGSIPLFLGRGLGLDGALFFAGARGFFGIMCLAGTVSFIFLLFFFFFRIYIVDG
jgi:hypothetical protein